MLIEFFTPITVTIEKLVYGGYGLAHYKGKVIMVSNALPGESCVVEVVKKRKGMFYARMLEISEPGAIQRIEPQCVHFGSCGGCNYQNLEYKNQLEIKESILREIFPEIELSETIYSEQGFNYRNKCEFTFGQDKETGELVLGMHAPGKYFEILELTECYLLPEVMWQILQYIRDYARESGLEVYRDLDDKGFWQTVTVREARDGDQLQHLVLLKVSNTSHPLLKELSEKLQAQFDSFGGLYVEPTPRGEIIEISGENKLIQSFGQQRFQYGVENFFQINTAVTQLVLDRIADLVRQSSPELLIDLFSGVGILGIYSAAKLQSEGNTDLHIISAEADQTAAGIAEYNAELNSLDNFDGRHMNLYAGGWGDKFIGICELNRTTLIIDPPRAGIAKKTIKQIGKFKPETIIYMSCNSTTQKRDLDLICEEHGYEIKELQLIDMFPQTYHLESLAYLQRV